MELVGAVVGTGVLTTVVTLWFGRRKADVEAEVTLSGGYGELVAELRSERVELRAQLTLAHNDNRNLLEQVVASRQEIGELRNEVAALKADLARATGNPPLSD